MTCCAGSCGYAFGIKSNIDELSFVNQSTAIFPTTADQAQSLNLALEVSLIISCFLCVCQVKPLVIV